MKHIHLIGIGGTGLSAIALVLLERGYVVSGSDQQLSPLAQRLQEKGVRVSLGHRASNIVGADVDIRSSAIPDDNPEVEAALLNRIPVLKRLDFLNQLMDNQRAIAVAGAHGKTTTTAMLAWMLSSLGFDPSYVIGGDSKNFDNNAHSGSGDYFVIEADEYDRMFHGIDPYLAVITNIEHDHPDCYASQDEFFQAFLEFVDHIQPAGKLLICGDDPGANRLLGSITNKDLSVFTYGMNSDFDYFYSQPNLHPGGGCSFIFSRSTNADHIFVNIQIPGEHNILNACAALATADILNIPLSQAVEALGEFKGTGRRFDVLGEANGVLFIDDYAHHPSEIKATLAAARQMYKDRKIWALWQPHTYSRARKFFKEFLEAFLDADFLILTDIFAARESSPQDGFSTGLIVDALISASDEQHPHIKYIPELQQASSFLEKRLLPGDILIILSAGDAHDMMTALMERVRTQPDVLLEKFGKDIQHNVHLARFTSARMGGSADLFFEAHNMERLVEISSFAMENRIPFKVLGSGSNVLVSDAGVRGLVVLFRSSEMRFDDDAHTVWVESGTSFGGLARKAASKGLSGLEWADGIPGTVGGAVVGNAGAYGSDMTSNLILAEILHLKRQGFDQKIEQRKWSLEALAYSYRSSLLKRLSYGCVVLAAIFQLKPSSKEDVQAKMHEFRQYRQTTQPPGASLGSIFKNPPNGYAGQLIEACGLKGARMGDAQVSPVHANFIVNLGQATSTDFYRLIKKIQRAVVEKFAIQLELEIELIGEWRQYEDEA